MSVKCIKVLFFILQFYYILNKENTLKVYEDDDFIITCSGTEFDKFVIFLNSAAGLDRVFIDGIYKSYDKCGTIPNGIYTPYKINEINFICKNANWYQRRSVDNCISVIKNLILGHEDNTVIYGSSMGGFGAIHFGAVLGITSIAFSPQASLDEEFDIALDWKQVANYAKFYWGSFVSNITNGKCSNSKIYIFYDGRNILDKKQALYIIKNCKKCISFNIPYSGHACTNIINKHYRIKNIIMEIINKNFIPSEFKKSFFKKYNIYEYKRLNGFEYFYYLLDIVKDKDFYMILGIMNYNKYKDLCISILHTIEKKYNNLIDEVITCMINRCEITQHAMNIKRKLHKNILENEYERIKICALFYFNRKKYEKALLLYDLLYKNNKLDSDLCIMLAKTMHKINLNNEAISILQEFILFNGKNDNILFNIAVILFDVEKYSESRKYLAPLIRMYNKAIYYIYYARCLKEDKKVKEAIIFLNNNIDKFYNNADYIAHLGAYMILSGDKKEGKMNLYKAKSMDKCPNWVDSWIKRV